MVGGHAHGYGERQQHLRSRVTEQTGCTREAEGDRSTDVLPLGVEALLEAPVVPTQQPCLPGGPNRISRPSVGRRAAPGTLPRHPSRGA